MRDIEAQRQLVKQLSEAAKKLEEEVTEFLSPEKSACCRPADAQSGYRNGYRMFPATDSDLWHNHGANDPAGKAAKS